MEPSYLRGEEGEHLQGANLDDQEIWMHAMQEQHSIFALNVT